MVAQGADFSFATLQCTGLRGVDLERAVLVEIDATCPFTCDAGAPLLACGVDAANATFRDADLRGANSTGANLTNVNLAGAVAASAKFVSAGLSSTELTGTDLSDARFCNANLNTVTLESILPPAESAEPWYDSDTTFPAGFDPVAANWKLWTEGTIPCPEPSAWFLQSGALAILGLLGCSRRRDRLL
jgi:hypothetical protein